QDGSWLHVVNVQDNSLTAINLENNQSFTVAVGEHPYCATASPDGNTVYVSNTQADSVSVIDIQQKRIIATINVGGFPEGINYDHSTHRIYVANWFDNSVSVINARNNQLEATIPTGIQSRAFGQFIAEAAH
ncbi:MAG TPA: beta-propeller fold lactonase family protein, partial [Methylophilaceae bacterium]|nr:beta-propeller fold lactonase family protein [Methylophilaceae bacterium]